MKGQIQKIISRRIAVKQWRVLIQNRHKSDGTDTSDIPKKSESNTSENTENRVEELLENSIEESDSEFPSDVNFGQKWRGYDNYDQWASSQKKHAYRPKGDLSDKSILLFPGQGTQFVGMGKKLLSYPNVIEIYQTASKILGYDLLKLCLNGPKTQLDKTEYSQPAIFVTSLAAIEKLKEEHPKAIENCITAAGYSLGEISALVFAGSLTFEEGVELVKVRGKAMQNASHFTPSGMMSVKLTPQHQVKFACSAARMYCSEKLMIEDPVCSIASHLYTECKVIGGHEEALAFLEKTCEEFGLKDCKRLPVSGAFHTNLMVGARKNLRNVLEDIEFRNPAIRVHSNVTSLGHRKRTVKEQLIKQLTKPVKWEQIMQILYTGFDAYPKTYELGPGKQLGFLLRNVNAKAFRNYKNVEV